MIPTSHSDLEYQKYKIGERQNKRGGFAMGNLLAKDKRNDEGRAYKIEYIYIIFLIQKHDTTPFHGREHRIARDRLSRNPNAVNSYGKRRIY